MKTTRFLCHLIAITMALFCLSTRAAIFTGPVTGGSGGPAAFATNAASVTTILADNSVITNSGTYFLSYGVSASINLTNGGVVTVLGNGIITSNWLANGAVEYIHCDTYCPSGGITGVNKFTNE